MERVGVGGARVADAADEQRVGCLEGFRHGERRW
jgi:hypothetical protein